MVICEPLSGIIEGVAFPAMTIHVLGRLFGAFAKQLATPFWSTVAPTAIFPGHAPAARPTHHVTSCLVSCCGEGGLLKVPVAVNWTCPLGKFCALATAGITLTDCNVRELPQASVASIRVRRSGNRSWGRGLTAIIKTSRACCDSGMDASRRKGS